MKLLKVATVHPKQCYSTSELVEAFPCNIPDEIRKNISNLGVSKRFIVSQPKTKGLLQEEELKDLCQEASAAALQGASVSSKEITCLISTYDANPFLSPGLSQLILGNLDLSPYTALINVQGVASTAFLKALDLAEHHLAMHKHDFILICISGVSSFWFQNQVKGFRGIKDMAHIRKIRAVIERNMELRKWVAVMQYFLFGDGVAAAIISDDGEGLEIKKIVDVTNIRKRDYLAGFTRLEATGEPFKFGLHSHLDKSIPKLGAEYTKLALDRLWGEIWRENVRTVTQWALHTGSARILGSLTRNLGIEESTLKESYEILNEFGNLAGASLPFILDRVISRNGLHKEETAMLLGYGWGFSASAGLLKN